MSEGTVEAALELADQLLGHPHHAACSSAKEEPCDCYIGWRREYVLARGLAALRSRGSSDTRLTEALKAAESLHAGLTCEHDPMDVDERIERLGLALAAARADAPQDPNEKDGQIWGPT